MQPSAPRLRPMGLADLLDATFALYRQNFALFAGIAAVLAVPQLVLNLPLAFFSAGPIAEQNANGTSSVEFNNLVPFLILLGVGGLITLVFSALVTGALAYAISQRYLNRPVSVEQAYRSIGRSKFVRLIFAPMLEGLLVFLGFIALIVPGLIFLTRWQFISQAIVLEDQSITGSMRRSWNLVRGDSWRVFGIVLLLYIMVSIVGGAVGGLAGAVTAIAPNVATRVVTAVISSIVSVFVQPFQLGFLTLLYYDLRIRKEGYDLEHMLQSMDGATAP